MWHRVAIFAVLPKANYSAKIATWLAQKDGGTTSGNDCRIYNYYNSLLCYLGWQSRGGKKLSFKRNFFPVRWLCRVGGKENKTRSCGAWLCKSQKQQNTNKKGIGLPIPNNA